MLKRRTKCCAGHSPFSVIPRDLTPEQGDSIFLTRGKPTFESECLLLSHFHPRGPNSFTLLLPRRSSFRNHCSKAKVYFCVRTDPLGPCLTAAHQQFDAGELRLSLLWVHGTCLPADLFREFSLPQKLRWKSETFRRSARTAICPAQQDFLDLWV